MLKPDQIPAEAVEAAKSAYTAEIYKGQATAREYHAAMEKAIAAALGAWPEIKYVNCYFTLDTDHYRPAVILPLPAERPDAELPKE